MLCSKYSPSKAVSIIRKEILFFSFTKKENKNIISEWVFSLSLSHKLQPHLCITQPGCKAEWRGREEERGRERGREEERGRKREERGRGKTTLQGHPYKIVPYIIHPYTALYTIHPYMPIHPQT